MSHRLCKGLNVQERDFSSRTEERVSAGVTVLFTPAPLLQRAGSLLLGVTC